MKKFYVIGLSLVTSYMAFSQQNQTGTPPTGGTAQKANSAWYKGGNNFSALNISNIFAIIDILKKLQTNRENPIN